MIYFFQTYEQSKAVAALLVYAIWQSRDRQRYKITPDVWSQQERFVKSSAKRARSLADFIERYKPKVLAGTLQPRAMEAGIKGPVPLLSIGGGAILEVAQPAEQREFLVGLIESSDQGAVLRELYSNTATIILLVRDRLERERPRESRIAKMIENSDDDNEEDED